MAGKHVVRQPALQVAVAVDEQPLDRRQGECFRPVAEKRTPYRPARQLPGGVIGNVRPRLSRSFRQGQDFGMVAVFHCPVSFTQAMYSKATVTWGDHCASPSKRCAKS